MSDDFFKNGWFNLELRVGPSENEFNKNNPGVITEIKRKLFEKKRGRRCLGCGFESQDVDDIHYNVHIYRENKEDPYRSDAVILCKACHYTQHIDKAIEKCYVEFVNSAHEQGTLIYMIRNEGIDKGKQERKIIDLTATTPEVVMGWVRNGTPIDTRLKVIFNKTADII